MDLFKAFDCISHSLLVFKGGFTRVPVKNCQNLKCFRFLYNSTDVWNNSLDVKNWRHSSTFCKYFRNSFFQEKLAAS